MRGHLSGLRGRAGKCGALCLCHGFWKDIPIDPLNYSDVYYENCSVLNSYTIRLLFVCVRAELYRAKINPLFPAGSHSGSRAFELRTMVNSETLPDGRLGYVRTGKPQFYALTSISTASSRLCTHQSAHPALLLRSDLALMLGCHTQQEKWRRAGQGTWQHSQACVLGAHRTSP